MASLKPALSITAVLMGLLVPLCGKGGRAEAGSSSAGAGTGSAGSAASGGYRAGAPVATHNNATFHNPIGIGQQVPAATPSINTSTTGNQVSTPSSSLAISGEGSTTGTSQGPNISTSSSTANRVGTSSNGLPIGAPGSGPGSPEDPY